MTLGSLAATANSYFRGASGVPLENVVHYPFGCEVTCQSCEMACGTELLDQLEAQYADSSSGLEAPAAFLVEAIQAEGGVNVASKAWLQKLAKLAKSIGSLLIVDDIQVGVGRTGSFFSFDDYDIEPDIICLAKGVGGIGTPLAMNLVKPEVDEHWSPGEHTGTFRGQNLSFVAGAEALSYFENDQLMDEVKTKTDQIRSAVDPLEKFPQVQVRGKGMIVGLDVGSSDRATDILKRCFEQGLLITACGTGGRVLKIIPPLTIPAEDLAEGLDILVNTAEAVLEAA